MQDHGTWKLCHSVIVSYGEYKIWNNKLYYVISHSNLKSVNKFYAELVLVFARLCDLSMKLSFPFSKLSQTDLIRTIASIFLGAISTKLALQFASSLWNSNYINRSNYCSLSSEVTPRFVPSWRKWRVIYQKVRCLSIFVLTSFSEFRSEQAVYGLSPPHPHAFCFDTLNGACYVIRLSL